MWVDAAFGSNKTGIATVGYRLYDNTGGDAQARTTTNVVEIGNGAYGVEIASVPADTVGVEWDTGEGTPVWAHETIGVNIESVNTVVVTGTGASGDEWGP